jgi:RND family efflux transporter MFP subunit
VKTNAWKVTKYVAAGIGFVAIVAVLMMALAGVFNPKIGEAVAAAEQAGGRPVGEARLVEARLIRVPRTEAAVGTIRAVHETSVASKLLAKVVEVNVQAGQPVAKDDVLVRLDDEDLQARLEQAQAAVAAARAARDQAQFEYDRVKDLRDRNVASRIEFERVETALESAQAELERAEQARREAETILSYATIRSPMNGIVVDKKVEVGDTVGPGQVLVTLYDPTRMQLIASVRESLTQRLDVGQTINVRVDALNKTCEGQISEIVPEAQAASRSFQVKVTGPCPPGIYSGMFGRLLIPLDAQEVLVIPRSAVRRVGQLHLVDVADDDVLRRRIVQVGRTFGDDIEILSGLRAGERVAVGAPAGSASEGA